jgi:predicted O-linked N-acetylglucosamine transferase (SPINDLY family)
MNDLSRAREYLDSGETGRAAALLDQVIRSSPRDADALVLRALVAVAATDADDALRWLSKAAKAAPNRWDVQHDIGTAYLRLDRAGEAARRFEIAASLNPSSVATLLQLGRVHLDGLKQPSVAKAAFGRAVALATADAEAVYHLGKSHFELGEIDEAVSAWRQARELAERTDRPDVVEYCLKAIAVAIPGSPQADNAEIRESRTEWVASWPAAHVPPADFAARDRSPDRPLRLGYVSSFFNRENWMKPVWALLNAHDRELFQISIFSFGPVPGGENPGVGVNTAWRPHDVDRVFDVGGLSTKALAKVIADEQVDLLVDLNGYSDTERFSLFAMRPAPVIVGWFNMYATTAMPWYDYLIGDRHVVAVDEEAEYSEQIVRVAGSYLTFDVGYRVPEVTPPPCAATGRLTFGSLGSRYKITPEVIRAWSEILMRCGEARLLLRNADLDNELERDYLLGQFERHGIDRARVELVGRAEHFEFIETYSRIDIALDTFPYNGGTTTTEAIWQGAPVVAFAGNTWASRTSATILREGGLGDWVADDLDGYIELAAHWGVDPRAAERLGELRSSMRDRLRGSSACDTRTFARSMESLYREMWCNWCRKTACCH